MDIRLLLFFIVLNIVNVILQTVKSLATTKGGKWSASIWNAIAYGAYTVLLIYMTCDLTLWAKVVVVALCNLVGVFIVKLIEEKLRKDRLWKIEATFPAKTTLAVVHIMENRGIPCNYIRLSNKHTLFNFYCSTQDESRVVKKVIEQSKAKYFASEAKIL